MHTVNLTYFKKSGKYYTSTTYETELKHMFEIFDDVHLMHKEKRLPGLMTGGGDNFIVHITVPTHPNNHPGLSIL